MSSTRSRQSRSMPSTCGCRACFTRRSCSARCSAARSNRSITVRSSPWRACAAWCRCRMRLRWWPIRGGGPNAPSTRFRSIGTTAATPAFPALPSPRRCAQALRPRIHRSDAPTAMPQRRCRARRGASKRITRCRFWRTRPWSRRLAPRMSPRTASRFGCRPRIPRPRWRLRRLPPGYQTTKSRFTGRCWAAVSAGAGRSRNTSARRWSSPRSSRSRSSWYGRAKRTSRTICIGRAAWRGLAPASTPTACRSL